MLVDANDLDAACLSTTIPTQSQHDHTILTKYKTISQSFSTKYETTSQVSLKRPRGLLQHASSAIFAHKHTHYAYGSCWECNV